MKIVLISYLRDSEIINEGLVSAVEILKKNFSNIYCCLFTSSTRANLETFIGGVPLRQIRMDGTKYKRIISLLSEETTEETYYLSIDNDMIFDSEEFPQFINETINKEYDIGWGKIQAQNVKGFISKLVAVDKLLSHNLLRPFLWKIRQGISIPGQCFLIKASSFKSGLMNINSFLDDLALGVYINKNKLKVNSSKRVIGFEYPNVTFLGLCKQRKRWARGYYDVLKGTRDNYERRKVIMHGFCYHGLWIVNLIFFILLCRFSWIVAIPYTLLIGLLMTVRKPKYFLYGIIYQFVFPIFHIVWGINLIKGDKNNGNG